MAEDKTSRPRATLEMPAGVPVDMRDRIKERAELAHFYAEDGAYYSAARVLGELADEVRAHAQKVNSGMANG